MRCVGDFFSVFWFCVEEFAIFFFVSFTVRKSPSNAMKTFPFTAIIEREGDGFAALCPELDVASQGQTIEEARHNLREAVELFLEYASEAEIAERLREEVYVTRMEAEFA